MPATTDTGVTPFSGADGNGDGDITVADYEVWKDNYTGASGAAAAGSSAPTATPEPTTATLFGLLLGSLIGFRKRVSD